MEQITINKDEVPNYLKNGDNYNTFFEYEETITINRINYRNNDNIPIDFNDFINLYKTIDFWSIKIPKSMYEYYKLNKNDVLRYLYSFDHSYSKIMIEYLSGYHIESTNNIGGCNVENINYLFRSINIKFSYDIIIRMYKHKNYRLTKY